MKKLGAGLILIVAGILFIFSPEPFQQNKIVSLAFADDDDDDKRNVHSFKVFTGDGPPPQKLGHSNDLYIDQASEFFDIYVKNGKIWELIDNLQGPAGEAGSQGEQGSAGPQGEQGPKGEDGTKISSGTGDPNGVVFGNTGDFFVDTEIGNLWQLGEDLLWIIQGNLKGPKGDAGDTGSQGESGLSCWDINENEIFDSETEDKDGDNKGTTADCQGPQGEKGDTGATGPQGIPGIQGNAGFNSVVLTTQLGIGNQNCQDGGVKIEIGLDSNNNNQLDIGEINPSLTQFVCNGSQGPQGEQGPPGPVFLELPISHYRFEQNVLDSEGGNHGTVTGTETYVPGQKAFAFDFDGITYITLTNKQNFDFDLTDEFSVCSWIKTASSLGGPVIFAKHDNSLGYDLRIAGNGKLDFILRNTPFSNEIRVSTVQTDLANGEWKHVCATYNGNGSAFGVNLYINGISVSTNTFSDNLTSSISNNLGPTIGALSDGTHSFTGQIDDVLVFDIELTVAQVAAISG